MRLFSLVVITSPVFFAGEATCLEGLLAAGLEKLHIRKPGAKEEEIANLLRQMPSGGHSRLVLHGSRQLADEYGIPQIHCPLKVWKESKTCHPVARAAETADGAGKVPAPKEAKGSHGEKPMVYSTSLHSWEEMDEIGRREINGTHADLEYVFISPLFDSISKSGYVANTRLLQRPAGPYTDSVNSAVKVIGLGGIDKDTIIPVIEHGWDGAAVLGWIWKEPDAAVERFEKLQQRVAASRS